MKNFIFKSNASDLQKMFQSIETTQKNVLYLTYRMDMVLKYLTNEKTNTRLQSQVDDYFEDDSKNIPEEDKEPDWALLLQSYVLVLKLLEDTYTKVYVNKIELLIIPIEKQAYTTVELYVVLNTD